MREAAAELDHLDPARDLAHRVGEHLAVLGGEEPRDLFAVLVEQLADPEEQLGAPRERERPPGGERRLRRLHGAVDLLDRAKSTAPVCTPVAGLYTGPCAPTARRTRPPPIQWLIGLTATGASISSVMSILLASSQRSVARPRRL